MGNDFQTVLLASEDQLQINSIGQSLAAFHSVPIIDGTQQAKKCWGFVGERMDEAEGNRLISCLLKTQIKSVMVPSASIRQLPEITPLVGAEFGDEKMVGVDHLKNSYEIPFQQIQVLGAAGVHISSTQKVVKVEPGASAGEKAVRVGIMLATGLPVGMGAKQKTVEKTVSTNEFILLLDILVKDNHRYRIMADKFNYTFLKARREYNAMGNFKLLLRDLVARAPNARKSKGTQVLLADQPVSTMGYESIQDLERECRWLWAIG